MSKENIRSVYRIYLMNGGGIWKIGCEPVDIDFWLERM